MCGRVRWLGTAGALLGMAAAAQGQQYAFFDLGTYGGPMSYAYGVNNQGVVVGVADSSFPYVGHAFLWVGGPLSPLGGGIDPNCGSCAYDINDQIQAPTLAGLYSATGSGFSPTCGAPRVYRGAHFLVGLPR